jgi:hypothetical protein
VIFNEAAIKEMGLNNPIGKVIRIQNSQLEIIGVTKNSQIQLANATLGSKLE